MVASERGGWWQGPVRSLTPEEIEQQMTTCCWCGRPTSGRRYLCLFCSALSQGLADEQAALNRELRRARLSIETTFHLRDSW